MMNVEQVTSDSSSWVISETMIHLPTQIELRAIRVADKNSYFAQFVNELRKVLSGPLEKLQVRTQRDFVWRRLHQKCHWHELTCRAREVLCQRSLLKRAGGHFRERIRGTGFGRRDPCQGWLSLPPSLRWMLVRGNNLAGSRQTLLSGAKAPAPSQTFITNRQTDIFERSHSFYWSMSSRVSVLLKILLIFFWILQS